MRFDKQTTYMNGLMCKVGYLNHKVGDSDCFILGTKIWSVPIRERESDSQIYGVGRGQLKLNASCSRVQNDVGKEMVLL